MQNLIIRLEKKNYIDKRGCFMSSYRSFFADTHSGPMKRSLNVDDLQSYLVKSTNSNRKHNSIEKDEEYEKITCQFHMDL